MTTISDVLTRDDRAQRNIKLATQALSDAFEEGRSEGYAEALASHACEPKWRPITADEIQAGWEVRSRRHDGSEASWGVACRQDTEGDWRTQTGALLTYAHLKWTYETTAPVAPDVIDAERMAGMLDGRCLADVTHRGEGHRQSFCMLPADHAPLAHDDCMGSTWTDGDHYVAATGWATA